MKSKEGMERRKYKRVTIIQEMFFGDRGIRKMDDISEQGMFISTPDVYMKGSILDLKFRLFNQDRPISVKAEVRYVQEGVGIGVRFMNLKPENREQIKKFVDKF